MNFPLAPSYIFTTCSVLLLAWASLHDLAARTVPNLLPATILLLGIGVRAMDHAVLPSLAIAGITFIALFSVWLTGAIGGGDVKLWSASMLLIQPHWQVAFSCATRILLAGGLLALVYLLLQRIVPWLGLAHPGATRPRRLIARVLRAEIWRISHKAPLPYAFAIAGGTILTLLPFSLSVLR